MLVDGLELSILGPAFVAGLLVLTTHVPLGHEVLKRGIIFIDLAIAQIAGFGVILASHFGWEAHGWHVQLAALTAALLGALGLSVMEKYWEKHQEALIGIVFILAATASVLLLANNPQAGDSLKDLLVGQILWTTWDQLLPLLVTSALILGVLLTFKERIGSLGFYVLFALAVTSSVQLVGIYLVFASLIIPAIGSLGHKKPILIGFSIGALGYGLGLALSSLFDLPSGAIIVWSISIIALAFKLLIKKA